MLILTPNLSLSIMNVRLLKTRSLSVIARTTIVLLFLSFTGFGQKTQSLPRGTPEAAGVSSKAIIDFMDAMVASKNEIHSFMIVRHGKVIAEAWNKPYAADIKHMMYSTSKSFTATAIGFAVADKKLTVDDRVVSYFPDDLPETVSPYLDSLRIRDLLTMSVGHATDPTFEVNKQHDWIKAFLNTPIVHPPGTKFLYNSVATYMLSAIIQKVTGEKVIAYLQPRLFAPLGIKNIDWETDPSGINTGGWGLRLKTDDMAKFGQLFLQKGSWEGKQILPASWVEEASSFKIDQAPEASAEQKVSNDWLQGYAYQMWRSRYHSYRCDGAYGQFILILPDQDAVIAITAETPDMQSEINLVWQYLLPAFKANLLPANAKMLAQLRQRSTTLALPVAKASSSPIEKKISGKTFSLSPDRSGLKSIGFRFSGSSCALTLQTDSVPYHILFGNGKWAQGTTTKKAPSLTASAEGSLDGLDPFKVAGSYAWKDANTLEFTFRYLETPHTETINCVFDGETVSVDFKNIFNQSDTKRLVLKGNLLKEN
ncbi:MAG: serine hydrolase domain-containing protein [Sphingobacteriaceae bacterium]